MTSKIVMIFSLGFLLGLLLAVAYPPDAPLFLVLGGLTFVVSALMLATDY